MTIRIYHEMNMGKWWWDTQVIISLISFCSSCSQDVFRRRSKLQLETKTSRSYRLSFHLIKLSSQNSVESWHTLSTSPLVTFQSISTENLLNRPKCDWPISQPQNWIISPIRLHVATACRTSLTIACRSL